MGIQKAVIIHVVPGWQLAGVVDPSTTDTTLALTDCSYLESVAEGYSVWDAAHTEVAITGAHPLRGVARVSRAAITLEIDADPDVCRQLHARRAANAIRNSK